MKTSGGHRNHRKIRPKKVGEDRPQPIFFVPVIGRPSGRVRAVVFWTLVRSPGSNKIFSEVIFY